MTFLTKGKGGKNNPSKHDNLYLINFAKYI